MEIIRNDRIELLARAHGYFPAAFRWRGRRFEVVSVEKCWTVQRPVAQRLFRVRCAAGSFLLAQTVAGDTWQVKRWPLALLLPKLKPSQPARFPLPRSQRRPRLQPASIRHIGGPKMAAATPKEPSTAKSMAPAAQSLAMRANS